MLPYHAPSLLPVPPIQIPSSSISTIVSPIHWTSFSVLPIMPYLHYASLASAIDYPPCDIKYAPNVELAYWPTNWPSLISFASFGRFWPFWHLQPIFSQIVGIFGAITKGTWQFLLVENSLSLGKSIKKIKERWRLIKEAKGGSTLRKCWIAFSISLLHDDDLTVMWEDMIGRARVG